MIDTYDDKYFSVLGKRKKFMINPLKLSRNIFPLRKRGKRGKGKLYRFVSHLNNYFHPEQTITKIPSTISCCNVRHFARRNLYQY